MKKAVILLSVLLATPAFAAQPPISAIVAVVNDDVITSLDIRKEAALQAQEAARKGLVPPADRTIADKEALDRLIEKKLVDQKIRELNIRVGDDELRQAIEDVKRQNSLSQDALVAALASQGLTFDHYKAQVREQLERLRLVSQEVRAKVTVDESEVSAYYEGNQAAYREDETLRARDIFIAASGDMGSPSYREAMSKALKVTQLLEAGGDFADLARRYSEDPSAKDGGSLGSFRKGDMMPEFQEALAHLKAGEVSGIIRTGSGLHIMKLEDRIPGKLKPLSEVKGEIQDLLFRKKSEERFDRWVKDLRREAVVEMKE